MIQITIPHTGQTIQFGWVIDEKGNVEEISRVWIDNQWVNILDVTKNPETGEYQKINLEN